MAQSSKNTGNYYKHYGTGNASSVDASPSNKLEQPPCSRTPMECAEISLVKTDDSENMANLDLFKANCLIKMTRVMKNIKRQLHEGNN